MMANKTLVLISLVAFLALVGALSFNLDSLLELHSTAVPEATKVDATAEDHLADTNDGYLPRGAIAKAKGLSGKSSFKEEAKKLFGLYLLSFEEDEYLLIRERLLENDRLAYAVRIASGEGVTVLLKAGIRSQFWVGTGAVAIDINASDEEIVRFLTDSVPVAKARKAEFEELKKESTQYGMTLFLPSDGEYYKKIRSRLAESKDLVRALKIAAEQDVLVYPNNRFSIGANYLHIDVNATDEEIIKFLLGS